MENIVHLEELLTTTLILVPILTGLVQAVKATGVVPKNFVPLLSACLGIGTGLIAIECTVLGGLAGMAMGLSAVGLWEFGKKALHK